MKDPIVEEVRRIREEHAAQFDFDPKRIAADVQRRTRNWRDWVTFRHSGKPKR